MLDIAYNYTYQMIWYVYNCTNSLKSVLQFWNVKFQDFIWMLALIIMCVCSFAAWPSLPVLEIQDVLLRFSLVSSQ